MDLNIPTMKMVHDPNVLGIPVNINLDQSFEYNYQIKGLDTDKMFYSANLLYNFDIVNTVVYHYPSVNFKIWDHFQNFTKEVGSNFQYVG